MNVKYLWCIVGAGGTVIIIIWNIFTIEPVHEGGGLNFYLCLIHKQKMLNFYLFWKFGKL